MLNLDCLLYKIHLMLICSNKPIIISFKIISLSQLWKRTDDKCEYELLHTQQPCSNKGHPICSSPCSLSAFTSTDNDGRLLDQTISRIPSQLSHPGKQILIPGATHALYACKKHSEVLYFVYPLSTYRAFGKGFILQVFAWFFMKFLV